MTNNTSTEIMKDTEALHAGLVEVRNLALQSAAHEKAAKALAQLEQFIWWHGVNQARRDAMKTISTEVAAIAVSKEEIAAQALNLESLFAAARREWERREEKLAREIAILKASLLQQDEEHEEHETAE